ncbi:MAG: TetR/AcrR family transcriptional regulator [Acidobacteria bacterium]|nr:TetR/AcrR family transcriptional regulator [Acidobacteriota bacterium]
MGDNRRGVILRRAARVFLERGYDGASMDEIAREAGLTKPGLYYHFASKTELLFAVMTFAMDELERETFAAMATASDPLEKLRAILHTHAWLITREKDRAFTLLITTELGSLDPEDRRVVVQRLRSYRTLIQATLEQLAGEGILRPGTDPDVAAHTLMGMIAWLSFWYRAGGRLDGPAIADMVTEMAMASVIPGPWRRPPADGSGG